MKTVGILMFDDAEVLDFRGPFEVFSVARRPGEGDPDPEVFQVLTVAELDVLLVPGGMGTRKQRLNGALIDWIRERDRQTEITASVCTGAFLLAEAGLLNGLRATTHWASVEWMRQQYPAVEMVSDVRFVDEGHVVTSAGISAGIDMSLHLVERLCGTETAAWTARCMEYDWRVRA